jgi:hypothetical protein
MTLTAISSEIAPTISFLSRDADRIRPVIVVVSETV